MPGDFLLQSPPPDAPGGGRKDRTTAARMDQIEFGLPEETPFDALAGELLSRTKGMFDFHLGMALGEYQNRWLEIVAVAQEVTEPAAAESARLHGLVKAKGPQHRRWQAEAKKVDGFVADAFHAAEARFLSATEPLLAAYDERFPEDEWFGLVLADYRACEAFGSLTLQQIIDLEPGL